MTITLIHDIGTGSDPGGGTGSFTISVVNAPAAGNPIIVVVVVEQTSLTGVSVTDTRSNTYHLDKSQALTGIGVLAIYSCLVPTTTLHAGDTITVNDNSTAAMGEASEWHSTVGWVSTVDTTAGAQGTSASPSSGNAGPTTNAVELVIGGIAPDNVARTVTHGTSLNNLTAVTAGNIFNLQPMYRIVTSTGSYPINGTMTSTGYTALAATYAESTVPANVTLGVIATTATSVATAPTGASAKTLSVITATATSQTAVGAVGAFGLPPVVSVTATLPALTETGAAVVTLGVIATTATSVAVAATGASAVTMTAAAVAVAVPVVFADWQGLVQDIGTGTTNGADYTITASGGTTPGSGILVQMTAFQGNTTGLSVTDDAGDTFTLDDSVVFGSGLYVLCAFSSFGTAGLTAGQKITVHCNGHASCAEAAEYHGLTGGALDQSAATSGTSSVPNSGATGTTIQGLEIVTGAIALVSSLAVTFATSGGVQLVALSVPSHAPVYLHPAYANEVATGAQVMSGNISSSALWGALCVTYYGALGPPTIAALLHVSNTATALAPTPSGAAAVTLGVITNTAASPAIGAGVAGNVTLASISVTSTSQTPTEVGAAAVTLGAVPVTATAQAMVPAQNATVVLAATVTTAQALAPSFNAGGTTGALGLLAFTSAPQAASDAVAAQPDALVLAETPQTQTIVGIANVTGPNVPLSLSPQTQGAVGLSGGNAFASTIFTSILPNPASGSSASPGAITTIVLSLAPQPPLNTPGAGIANPAAIAFTLSMGPPRPLAIPAQSVTAIIGALSLVGTLFAPDQITDAAVAVDTVLGQAAPQTQTAVGAAGPPSPVFVPPPGPKAIALKLFMWEPYLVIPVEITPIAPGIPALVAPDVILFSSFLGQPFAVSSDTTPQMTETVLSLYPTTQSGTAAVAISTIALGAILQGQGAIFGTRSIVQPILFSAVLPPPFVTGSGFQGAGQATIQTIQMQFAQLARTEVTVDVINWTGTPEGQAAHGSSFIPTAPSAPGIGSVLAGDGQATVQWTIPAFDGGRPITSYTIRTYIAGVVQFSTGITGNVTSGIVPGLTNGTTYTFDVIAINIIGQSPASGMSLPVTPERNAQPNTPLRVDGLQNGGVFPPPVPWSVALASVPDGVTVIVATIIPSGTGVTLSLNDGMNTYTLVRSVGFLRVFYAFNVRGLSNGGLITITPSSNPGQGQTSTVFYVPGALTIDPLDQVVSATGVGSAPSSGTTQDTLQLKEIVCGIIGTASPNFEVFRPPVNVVLLSAPSTGTGLVNGLYYGVYTAFEIVDLVGAYNATNGVLTPATSIWDAVTLTLRLLP